MRRLLVFPVLALAGCGAPAEPSDRLPAPRSLTAAQAHPRAAGAPAALARVPDSRSARTRLTYVSAQASARVAAAAGAPTAIPRFAPARTVLANEAISTAQSCLGDPRAQTIVGPGRLGRDAAIGVAVAPSAAGGLAVRVCGAPHYARHLGTFAREIRARFGRRAAEGELGERAYVSVELPVRRETLRLLSGGRWLDRLFTG